jgi:hypothetical protein
VEGSATAEQVHPYLLLNMPTKASLVVLTQKRVTFGRRKPNYAAPTASLMELEFLNRKQQLCKWCLFRRFF